MCHGSWKPDGRGDQSGGEAYSHASSPGDSPGTGSDGGDRKSHGERVDIGPR